VRVPNYPSVFVHHWLIYSNRFGLWKVATENAADVVYQAIKTGYRLFDGAFGKPLLLLQPNFCSATLSSEKDYGNEKEAGLGVKRAIEEGIVKREDLVIVSKLWCTFHEKERVEPIVRRQLEWWGIEYVLLLNPFL